MAETLTRAPAIDTYTHGVVDVAIEVEIDPKTNVVNVLFETNDGVVALAGTEGQQLAASNTFPVAAGVPLRLRLAKGPQRVSGLRIYTEVAIQPTTVKIISEVD